MKGTAGGKRKRKSYSIESVNRCVKIIEALADRQDAGLVELSEKVGLHYTTVFRFLSTLIEKKWVYQDPRTERYSLTLRVYQLGKKIVMRTRFIDIVRPFLRELNEKIKDAVFLGVQDETEMGVTVIDSFPSLRPVTVNLQLGRTESFYSTSIGKAYLAFLDAGSQDAILEKLVLKPFTSHTIRSVARLRQELAHIRDQGYALDNEEGMIGVKCVGAPILDQDSNIVASFSVAAPANWMTEARMEEVVPLVLETSRAASTRLGHQPGEGGAEAEEAEGRLQPSSRG